MTHTNDWLARYAASLIPVFGVPQTVLDHGDGCYVVDVDGARYLDLLGGIAVSTLGHGHPALVDAVTAQAARLIHVSNFFTTVPQVELAEVLLRIAGAPAGSGVFLANSGAEAVEAAVKLTRRTGRTRIIAAENAFHGRTTGALALTWKPAYREPFAPLMGEVVHVPYDDLAALREAVGEAGDNLAAVILEPIQGEAGVVPASTAYLHLARELTTAAGALLVLDEVQSGMGRTGDWFAHQAAGILPDAMTVAKGLAGGIPIGALVTFGPDVTGLLTPGQHGSTFGGNPLACAAGLATIRTIEADGLLLHAQAMGSYLHNRVMRLGQPLVADVRGRGLLRAIVLTDPVAAQVMDRARDAGFLVNAVTPDAIRLAPPLVIGAHELDTFIDALPVLLDGLGDTTFGGTESGTDSGTDSGTHSGSGPGGPS
jgi:acetylornithine aminotransferase